jgi:hypothetical protein
MFASLVFARLELTVLFLEPSVKRHTAAAVFQRRSPQLRANSDHNQRS